MRGDTHVRFGRRTGETGRWKQQHQRPGPVSRRGQQSSQSTKSPRSKRSTAPPPTFPMLPTTPQRATHDYERNGTVDLLGVFRHECGLPGAMNRTLRL